MLKNSKGIIVFSVLCYLGALACLGTFVYELVKQKGNYMESLGLLVALLVGGLMLFVIGAILNPPKFLNKNTFNFVAGLLLICFAGVTLAFCIYDCVMSYDTTTLIICLVVMAVSAYFGIITIKIAKQDINVDARIEAEAKANAKAEEEKTPLTACPYCGCKLKGQTTCPNCKSKL